MHVPDDLEIALHQRGVRLGFIERVVHVEEGLDGGAADLPHDGGGFSESSDHIALIARERFHQNRDAAPAGVRRDGRQALHEVPRGLGSE